MGIEKQYEHFAMLDVPVAVVSGKGKILFRNQAALKVSSCFRLGGNIGKYLEKPGLLMQCIKRKTAVKTGLCLPKGKLTVAILPDFQTEEPVLFFIIYENEQPSEGACFRASPSVFGKHDRPLWEDPSTAFLEMRAFSAAVFPQGKYSTLPFTAKYMCMYLNRFSAYLLNNHHMNIDARCTADCMDFPIDDFSDLMAALSSLCFVLLETAKDKKLDVRIYCERERMHIQFSFGTSFSSEKLTGILEKKHFRELHILSCVLSKLGWYGGITVRDRKAELLLECARTVPAGFFRQTQPDTRDPLSLAVDLLLVHFFSHPTPPSPTPPDR